jgi:hypothetical protein
MHFGAGHAATSRCDAVLWEMKEAEDAECEALEAAYEGREEA